MFSIASLILAVFFLARYQVGVNEKQYVNSLIQVHSDTLLTSKAAYKKAKNPEVKQLAKFIYERNEKIIEKLIKLSK